MSNRMLPIGKLFNLEKGSLQSTKCTAGEFDFITAAEGWKTHNQYSHECEALVFAAAASGSLGRTHYVDGKFTSSDLCFILTPKNEDVYPLNLTFYHFVFSSLRQSIVTATKSGTSKESINQTNLKKHEIPYFEIEQQDFWIGKLKNTLGLKNLLSSELGYQNTLLNKVRQEILQEAIEGKLSELWRSNNLDVKSASSMLNQLTSQKAELAKTKNARKSAVLQPVSEEEIPFAIPTTWALTRLGKISDVRGGITKNTIKRAGHKLSLPYLRVANVYANRLDLTEVKEIGVAEQEVEKYLLEKGDLLVVEGNGSRDQVGRVAIWDETVKPCIHQNHLINVRLMDKSYVNWVLFFYLSPLGREILEAKARTSTGLYNLSTGKIANLPLLLPPKEELKIIISKLDRLLALCDELQLLIVKNQSDTDALMRAVLHQAFSSAPAKDELVEEQSLENIDSFRPKQVDYYKRTLLAAEIVDQLQTEPTLGHLKLQKLIFLCQRTQGMQLPTNFLKQAAGPYDPKMARSIDKQLRDKQWFDYRKSELHKYQPLGEAGSHKGDFQKYFADDLSAISRTIGLFRRARSEEMEAVATLYACWEELLQSGNEVSNELLATKFYAWSEQKSRFPVEKLERTISWMTDNGIVPAREAS